MKRQFVLIVVMCLLSFSLWAQGKKSSNTLPVKYEEITAPDFVRAVEKAGGIAIIPLGILEKHGPHLPLGTDLINVREMVLRAVKKEYSVVFPPYYFGQIYEAKHQPGTIAYSPQLVWNLLQETCDELARNGFKKIILANGHGGNNSFVHYFCQAQLAKKRDYSLILFSPQMDSTTAAKVAALRQTDTGGHAGETETSMMLAHRPELAHPERGADQSGADLDRFSHLPYIYTGIWWYAKFPNHYAGDGSKASAEIGNLLLDSRANQLAKLIRILKKDERIQNLEQEFFHRASSPLKTEQ